jgi:hypothetical protein
MQKNSTYYLVILFACVCMVWCSCQPRVIKPKATCKRYAEDTHLVCSLYDTLKDKLWTADSIIINGKDYTQEVLASIGGYYVFAISGQTQAMGYQDYLQAPAYIEDGLGRVVHCYWYDVKPLPAVMFPLNYSGSPTSVPAFTYIAPLPLYFYSLSPVVTRPQWADSIIVHQILSASHSKFTLQMVLPDSVIRNVFSVH